MNDKMIFGQYVNVDSWIHRLDPRSKILCLFIMMIGIFFITNLYCLLGFFVFILLIVLSSKIPLNKFMKSFKMIALLMVFTTIFQLIFNRTGEIIKIGQNELSFEFQLNYINLIISILIIVLYFCINKYMRGIKALWLLICFIGIMLTQKYILIENIIATYNISIYTGGLNTAVLVLFRVLNILALSALLTFTTKPTEINIGIEGIFAPFKFMKSAISIFGMMISIALRFIPTLLDESQKILKAQASRGVDFNEGKIKEKIMQIVSLIVPMFVISYKKAEDLANAMEARGYIPGQDRTSINVLKYKTSDYLLYAFVLMFISCIIIFKIIGVL